jgi:hypothetical protein
VPVTDMKASQLIALRQYTVWIYRNGVLFWSGEQALRQGDLDSAGDNWVTITCYGKLEQLNSRFTVAEIIYAYQDGSEIVKALIAATQAEDSLGITEGTIASTTWREKTYSTQNIMDAIVSLANLIDGFDFEITDLGVLNISTFMGVDRSNDIILEYGVNVKSAKITEDFSKPATRAIIMGQTATVGDQVRLERDDLTQQGTYGLREYVESQMEVSDTPALEATGDSVLRKYGIPLLKISLDIVRGKTPTLEDFSLGDIIRVKIKNGIYDIDEKFRIFQWGVSYDEKNTETLTLTLSNFYIE